MRKIISTLLWIVFLGLYFLPVECSGIEKVAPGLDCSEIINYYQDVIPSLMEQEKALGLSIAVVDDENILWTQGFGFRDKDQKAKITPETMFSIQSMSKTFTATAVMLAVQDGLLDLDVPITTYLPAFKVNSCFEEHPERKMTLRHLLSHTAGFTHEAPLGNNAQIDRSSFEEHIQSISQTWLRCPVGERYYYSNLGIDLAGYILQVVSGKPFTVYVKEKLLQPLEMYDSTLDLSEIQSLKNRAVGQSRYLKKFPVKVPMVPAGGVYTNVVELAKFVQFHLNQGRVHDKSLLAAKYLQEMYTIPFPVKGQTEGNALGIWKGYSYQTNYYCHGGGGFGFLTNMAWYPKFNLGVIILTNTHDHNIHLKLSDEIFDRFIRLKIGNLSPFPTTAIVKSSVSPDADPAILKSYAGHYIGRGDAFDIKYDNDSLFLDYNRLQMMSRNEFFIGDYGFRVILDNDGTPKYIVRINDGIVWDYNDGPNDRPGPDKKEWRRYLGQYKVKLWGKTVAKVKVYLKNGYLYVDKIRLVKEWLPGLFFTSTGEAVDMRGKVPTMGNIKGKKIWVF